MKLRKAQVAWLLAWSTGVPGLLPLLTFLAATARAAVILKVLAERYRAM